VLEYSLIGFAELEKKLADLGDAKASAKILKAAVRNAMKRVMQEAQENVKRISPGERFKHKSYKGNDLYAGFAARSLKMFVFVTRKSPLTAVAKLGVRKEAYYALQFLELGTAKIKAVPWLTPAFLSQKDNGLRAIGETMRRRINRIARQRHYGTGAIGKKSLSVTPKGGMAK
jgi:HK97 gp10 family phage protein